MAVCADLVEQAGGWESHVIGGALSMLTKVATYRDHQDVVDYLDSINNHLTAVAKAVSRSFSHMTCLSHCLPHCLWFTI